MLQEHVRVTDVDSRRLLTLIEGSRLRRGRDASSIDWLERHLDEAEVTPAFRIGPDVVTMNSEIVVTDLDSGETFGFRLVFPYSANVNAGRISVLAPLGMAVLGRRAGQEISWEMPSGLRRLRVEEIVYQPEREGRDVA